jgi:hypothetical protein
MKTSATFVVGAAISLGGVLLGAWWAPFTVGVVVGLVLSRARVAVVAGALAGLLAWSLPLAAGQLRYGLGPATQSLAAIMGFTHLPAIPVVLTCVVGVLLGLTGAWLGSATRTVMGMDQPAISR